MVHNRRLEWRWRGDCGGVCGNWFAGIDMCVQCGELQAQGAPIPTWVGGLQLACVVFSCGDGSESGQRRVTSTQSFKKTIACTRGTPEQFLATGGSKDIYVEIFGKDASLPYKYM